VVVLGQMIAFGSAWMAELDLDSCVSNGELGAKPRLQFTHHVLRVGKRLVHDDDMSAERHVLG
jgi:hypothetical protein